MMRLSRRGFIGALSGAVASGPKAAVKMAEPLGLDKIFLRNMTVAEQRDDGLASVTEDKSWAKRRLARWLLPDWNEREFREYSVYELHPDLHALRSVSLSAKMRIQKHRAFQTYKRKNMSYLERVIKGEDW